ncbi:MAG: mechanosensitive ion channel [Gammaproteobacteria bacterium]|nr:MAG: mechanosensitive ion channel [Gammaproteobacteria bacterium]
MDAIRNYITDNNIIDLLISGAINLTIALAIFVIGKWLAKMSQNALGKLLRKRKVDDVLVDFLGTITFALVIIVVVVAAFDQLGIPATSFLAILGAAGLAIGLALKDSLSNFASGVMLVLFRPFTKGDFIDAGGVAGTVDEIRLVSTTLTTGDNKLITIPNALIYNSTITNFSAKDTRRIDMVFGVGYDDDLKVCASTLKKICDEHAKVLAEPATNIFITNLGDSSVDFAVRPWVKGSDYWGVRADILETAKLGLEAAGCSFPYPQTDVHLYQASQD